MWTACAPCYSPGRPRSLRGQGYRSPSPLPEGGIRVVSPTREFWCLLRPSCFVSLSSMRSCREDVVGRDEGAIVSRRSLSDPLPLNCNLALSIGNLVRSCRGHRATAPFNSWSRSKATSRSYNFSPTNSLGGNIDVDTKRGAGSRVDYYDKNKRQRLAPSTVSAHVTFPLLDLVIRTIIFVQLAGRPSHERRSADGGEGSQSPIPPGNRPAPRDENPAVERGSACAGVQVRHDVELRQRRRLQAVRKSKPARLLPFPPRRCSSISNAIVARAVPRPRALAFSFPQQDLSHVMNLRKLPRRRQSRGWPCSSHTCRRRRRRTTPD